MDRAKELRRNHTDAEAKLWSRLRAAQLGAKFRRQHPVAGYYADFCCVEHRLIVELDGGRHGEQQAYDARRTRMLEEVGFQVLRFWNDDVLLRTDEVLEAIVRALDERPPPLPNPLPRRRRGRGSQGAPQRPSDSVSPEAVGGERKGQQKHIEPHSSPSPGTVGGEGKGVHERIAPHSSLSPGIVGGEGKGVHKRIAPRSSLSPGTVGGEGKGVQKRIEPHNSLSPDAVGGVGKGVQKRAAPHSSLSPGTAGGEGWGEGEALASALRLRAGLYRLIRSFFTERQVLEVETPILSAAGNTDPNVESFTTAFSGHVDAGARARWLRTSPEYPLKRLLAAGVGDCYELGRVFRNGEAGGRHNPEFTMLEWYRVGWDHRRLAEEVVALVQAALTVVDRRAEVRAISYRELFLQTLGLDPLAAPIEALQAPLAAYGIDPAGLTRDDWLDLLITHRLQPAFPEDRITLVHDYPASQCALAKIRAGQPPVAERFELFLGRYELANGYHELNDAAEQRQRFERDNAVRRARGLREVPLDERLLAVLDAMPDCAGVALGVERLLMCMAGTDAIADVLAFPFADV